MFACLVAIQDRKNGLLAGLTCFICTMGKHIMVDGLIPPPPVMVMTAITLLAVVAAPGEWGKRAFVGFCLINAFTFITQPLMVLQDTFPSITAGSEAEKHGIWFLEVIALYSIMAAIFAATPDRDLGLAYSWQVVLPVLGKHVILDKSGPPAFMIALNLVGVAAAWYEYGWADLKPAAEKAMQSGPMKMHAIIVATGFVPYFAVESMGLSLPMVGLAAIDSSYAYTGATGMLTGMLAIFCWMAAYAEYTGKMEGNCLRSTTTSSRPSSLSGCSSRPPPSRASYSSPRRSSSPPGASSLFSPRTRPTKAVPRCWQGDVRAHLTLGTL
jgi:hypothetical protein